MKPVDDELFAHIKESLAAHEEEYVPGAWERFEKRGKRKTGWLWFATLSSAAAVFLIGFTLLYTGDKIQKGGLRQQVKNPVSKENVNTVQEAVAKITIPQTPDENIETIPDYKKETMQRTNSRIVNDAIIGSVNQPSLAADQVARSTGQFVAPAEREVIANPNGVETANKIEVIAKVEIREKDSVKNKTRSFQEFLDTEVKSNSAVAALKSSVKKTDKWEMGLMVAPSIGNAKKLNMGYGLSMGYALSDKVSISSGISYNELAASKSVGGTSKTMDAPANMPTVNDTKSLKSVDANLVGIDIPLGIKYYVSKKFYTNIGVSAFAVINQKQQNNYVQGSVEYAASGDQTNAAGFKAFFQERAVSEQVPSGEIRGDKYLGFYNVSFGFKQQISGSKAFSVEPFMKLPMKEFTKENLYLIGTGVRLKLDF